MIIEASVFWKTSTMNLAPAFLTDNIKAAHFIGYGSITFAGGSFEPYAIQNPDVAVVIID